LKELVTSSAGRSTGTKTKNSDASDEGAAADDTKPKKKKKKKPSAKKPPPAKQSGFQSFSAWRSAAAIDGNDKPRCYNFDQGKDCSAANMNNGVCRFSHDAADPIKSKAAFP